MITIGDYQDLTVVRVSDLGYMLSDKKDEVLGLAKQWAKTALTASGEIDKAKGSLKQYLSDHLDDLEVSDVSDVSSQASKSKK